jgi:hypothetical protein
MVALYRRMLGEINWKWFWRIDAMVADKAGWGIAAPRRGGLRLLCIPVYFAVQS